MEGRYCNRLDPKDRSENPSWEEGGRYCFKDIKQRDVSDVGSREHEKIEAPGAKGKAERT